MCAGFTLIELIVAIVIIGEHVMNTKELVLGLGKPLMKRPLLAAVVVAGIVVLAHGLQISANGLSFHWETGSVQFTAQGISFQIGTSADKSKG